ncbi:MAG: tetratricopeptide repeat protein [Planctomycetes bacterium]|nr:tetratricopeptide repeat protein [Planctomycetota bacterium]MCB9825492.1 tetratricopeptide repeat protein [Planctomycetota bacterium]MCB9829480.1 tetratricopeptide repeat protein [Planctomycetota bacterium]MCB9900586.1 tetratricopeptide repeat protein [Planctomycetota bacterium]
MSDSTLPDLRARALRGLALLLALALLALPGLRQVHADDDPTGSPATDVDEEERLEDIERHTERGLRAFARGNHDEVLARMKRLAELAPDDPLAPYLTLRVLTRTGKYEEAEALAKESRARLPEARSLRLAWWRLLRALSRHDAAGAEATAWLVDHPDDLPARVVAGWADEAHGRREQAYASYAEVVKAYRPRVTLEEDVTWVAEAALGATRVSTSQGVDLKQDVLDLLGRHVEEHENDQDASFALAEAWRSDKGPMGQAKARSRLRRLLDDNPEYADARVASARIDLVFWQQGAALKQLDRALATNPNHVDALALRASVNVGNGDYDAARKDLDRAGRLAPEDREVRAVRAALEAVLGNTAEHERLVAELLAYDPTYGQVHVRTAELLGERRRRYDLAAAEARRAIEVDPHDPSAWVVLGEALMNLGETDAAREAFGKGVSASKRHKDVHRDNWIRVLDGVIPQLKTLETPHFIIRLPAREAGVMQHYLPQLLEASWQVLGDKYGYEVETPIHVDAFERSDDFSVRSIGVPGLPALGVCFGRVITLLGPTAMPMGSFSWSRTAWHEYAHVVTLQESQGQVPRWLTEGLSVFEEQQRKDIWGRDMERQLFDRYHNDRLLRMGAINQAFQGPDILFAYYQGGLIADQLLGDRGFAVIPAMLREFAKDRPTADVFREVLGVDLDTYDATFRAYVNDLVKDYKMVPTWDQETLQALEERVRKAPDDAESWIRLAWAHYQRDRGVDAGAALAKAKALTPDAPLVQLLLGRFAADSGHHEKAQEHYKAFLDGGNDDLEMRLYLADRAVRGEGGGMAAAIDHLKAAKACFPPYAGKGNAYLALAKIYRGTGDMKAALAELEAYTRVQPHDFKARKELMSQARTEKRWEDVARLGEEMVDICPFGTGAALRTGEARPDMEFHRWTAEALQELGRKDEALRERRVQVELGWLLREEERLDAGMLDDLMALGDAALDAGLPDDALEAALAGIRLSPDHLGSRTLKQRALEAGGGR